MVDQPAVYTLQTLTTTERKYAQVDREALAVVFVMKKSHKYVYPKNLQWSQTTSRNSVCLAKGRPFC